MVLVSQAAVLMSQSRADPVLLLKNISMRLSIPQIVSRSRITLLTFAVSLLLVSGLGLVRDSEDFVSTDIGRTSPSIDRVLATKKNEKPEVPVFPLPFPPYTASSGCRVGLIPYLIPGEEYRDCHAELEEYDGGEKAHSALKEERGTGQHLFLKYGKEAVAKHGGWAKNGTGVDLWLLEDANSLACYWLHYHSSEAKNSSKFDRLPGWYTQDRERFVTKLLNDNSRLQGKPLVVIEDFIFHKLWVADAPKKLFKLVVEAGQVRQALRDERRHVLIPYATPSNEFLRPASDLVGDRYTVYFRAMCFLKGARRKSDQPETFGLKIRAALVNTLVKSPETSRVLAKCTCSNCNSSATYKTVRKELAESRFCLVVPGDTVSSRRLSDAIVAGCIPAIVGEPWHALPYLPYLNYSDFAVFVRIREPPFQRLGPANMTTKNDLRITFAQDPLEERFLGNNSKIVKELESAKDLLGYLESIPDAEVLRLKQGVRKVAGLFTSWNGPTAKEAISAGRTYAMHWALGAACQRMKEIGMLPRGAT